MLPPPDAAFAHYSDRQSLVTAGAEVAGQMWAEVDPARIVESWTAQVPELTVVMSGAQLGAARSADPYLDEVAAWQDVDPATVSPIDPRAFAGTASDGRGLASLLMSPAFSALQVIASGLGSMQAMSLGGQHLDTIARTQVADAGRLADAVSLTAHPGLDGYVRVVVGKTCARCVLLAGKKYRWNAGFDRHPRCDCIHLPCQLAEAGKLVQDPVKIYHSMTDRERSAAGWSKADQRALADGADLGQVTNAHRGVYTAGGRKFTTQGTTRRGLAGSRLGAKGTRTARLTPEQIYLEAGADRDAALRLLYDHGYLVNEPALIRRADLVLAAAEPSPTAALASRSAPTHVTIRPELEAARTPFAVSQAFRREYNRITGNWAQDVEFLGSAATAREHAEGLLRGLERFPDAKLRRVVTIEDSRINSYARSGLGDVDFNYRWTSPAARREYLASTRTDVEQGWHPRGTGSPMGIAVHEFGHVLDLHTLGDNIGGEVSSLIKRRAAEAGPIGAEDFVKFGSAEGALISREISGYATSHRHELIAEAFADVMMNGAKASRLSHEIFGLLEAEYRKGGLRVGVEVVAASEPAADLAKLTVAKLRALAKERGIKVPSRALKADIVKLLEGGTTSVGGDLSKLTIPKLRELAKERGVAIPSKALKADIVKLLDGAPAKTAAATVKKVPAKTAAKKIATKPEDLTVVELRALAQQHGIPLRLGLTKSDIIARIRMWEAGRPPILPGTAERRTAAVAARAAKAAAEATAKAAADKAWLAALRSPPTSSRNPTVLAGRGGDKWWELIKDDTGLTPIRIRNLTLDSGSYPYTIASGSAYRIQGVVYFVEDGYAAKLTADELVRGLWEVHQTLPPDSIHHQRGYAWLAGRNPADAYWEIQYNRPGFTSGATGGDGGTHVWNRSSGSTDYVTPKGLAETLRHEFGHNVSGAVAGQGMHDNGQLWADAGRADEAHAAQATIVSLKKEIHSHQIALTPDPSAGYPRGVSDYGQSSPAEDFAESVRLYLAGELGVARLTSGGPETPFYFRDVWPARAAHLDKLMPKVAAAQKAALKRLGR